MTDLRPVLAPPCEPHIKEMGGGGRPSHSRGGEPVISLDVVALGIAVMFLIARASIRVSQLTRWAWRRASTRSAATTAPGRR